jgi:hypothetical protein
VEVWNCFENATYTVKDFSPIPSLDVTNQTLPGRELLKIIPGQESLVSDIPVGDGKNDNLPFFTVYSHFAYLSLNLELKEWMHNSISKKRLNCAKNR